MKTLYLDLDETLIFTNPFTTIWDEDFDEDKEHQNFMLYNFKFDSYYVYKRPHLEEFLEFCNKNFKVVYYTASKEDYARNILDEITSDYTLLHRDDCKYNHSLDMYTKPRVTENCITIDDRKGSFSTNNDLIIKRFCANGSDEELLKMIDVLKEKM